MIFKILGLSVNALTVDGKYSLLNKDSLTQPVQMKTSKKPFVNFCLRFQNLYKVLNILKKKDDLKVYAFAKVRTAKDRFQKTLQEGTW